MGRDRVDRSRASAMSGGRTDADRPDRVRPDRDDPGVESLSDEIDESAMADMGEETLLCFCPRCGKRRRPLYEDVCMVCWGDWQTGDTWPL